MATVAPSANDLTRQQLDELDALLQRMLSLPLSPPESFAPTPPLQAYVPPMPMPVPTPEPVVLPPTAPRLFTNPAPAPVPEAEEAPEPTPFASPWNEFAPTRAPVSRPTPRTEKPAPAPTLEKTRPATLPEAMSASVVTEPATYVSPRSEPVPFLLAPLVGFNAGLNWSLGLLGMPGRILRSGFVKNLLALAGIGLLVYTGLKVAQIHGLVKLPMELPWPR